MAIQQTTYHEELFLIFTRGSVFSHDAKYRKDNEKEAMKGMLGIKGYNFSEMTRDGINTVVD